MGNKFYYNNKKNIDNKPSSTNHEVEEGSNQSKNINYTVGLILIFYITTALIFYLIG